MPESATQSDVELVRSLYDAFAEGDLETMTAGWTDDITWVAVEGAPYGGTYIGPAAVVEHVFTPLAADWSDFALEQKQFLDAGDAVVVTGVIKATASTSGEDVEAAFAHVVTIKDGLVTRFVEYADTHLLQQAL